MAGGLSQRRVFAKATWQTYGQWHATANIEIMNYEGVDLVDPEIKFSVAADQNIENNYGLNWTRSGNTITGRFVPERRVVKGNGGTQFFRLGVSRSVEGVGDLPHSFFVDGQNADPPTDDDEPPTTPTGLKLDAAGPRSLSLSWDPSSDNMAVGGYDVMVAVEGGEPVTVTVKTNSVTVGSLEPETEYRTIVQAFDVSGNRSGLSKPLAASTVAPPPDSGDWDMPRAPFVDYTGWPTPKLETWRASTKLDGAFLGFGTSPSEATKPEEKQLWWGGLTRGMYDGVDGTEHPGPMKTSTYQQGDLASFTVAGGKVAFSFGGASNVPMEQVETDISRIVEEYLAIIKNYGVTHLDFDFEGGMIHDFEAQARHVAVIPQVMAKATDASGKPVKVKISYTLPVDGAPGSLVGFNDGGIKLLQALADGGIQPSLVNGMLMEFGQTSPPSLYDASVVALEGMHGQISAIWPHWSSDQVWRRIGACPMFGQNNNGKKFFTDDMRKLVAFCEQHHVGCLSGWDLTRDDPAKSGVAQESGEFTKVLMTYAGPGPRMPLVATDKPRKGDQVLGDVRQNGDGSFDVHLHEQPVAY